MALHIDLTYLALQKSISGVIGIATVLALTLLTIYKNFKSDTLTPQGFKKIPVPHGRLPYIGHLLSLKSEPTFKIVQMQKNCGPIIRIFMGVQPWILISDPIMAHKLFMTNNRITSDRPFQTFTHKIYSLGQRGVVFADADKRWTRTRNIVLDILAPKNVENLRPSLELEADYIVNYLMDATIKENGVKILEPLQFSSMNIILKSAFGVHLASPQEPLAQEILYFVNTSMKFAGVSNDMSGFLPILSYVNMIYLKEHHMTDFIAKSRNPLARRMIKQALESETDCFVKTLYARKEEFGLDDDDIMVTITDLIAAGTDATGVTLAWSIVILCCYPEVQRKMRDEVDDFIRVHNRLPTFIERESFPFLISVQKECMRFRPTTSFGVPHKSTEDFEFLGYFIPKGSVLVSNMYAMHWNPERYSDPENFIPERFLNNIATMYAASNSSIENRDHYNFGWGRRLCPGRYLAEVQMFNIIIRLIAKSKILPILNAEGMPVYPDLSNIQSVSLNLLPKDDNIRIVARTDALI